MRTGLDLKYTHRVGLTDHAVNGRVFGGNIGHRQSPPRVTFNQLEAPSYRTQHPEPQNVDLEKAELIEIVLVPLDYGAIRHGGVLDRHEPAQGPCGDNETTNVLGQMPRETDQCSDQREKLLRLEAIGIEPDLAAPGSGEIDLIPPLQRPGELVDLIET